MFTSTSNTSTGNSPIVSVQSLTNLIHTKVILLNTTEYIQVKNLTYVKYAIKLFIQIVILLNTRGDILMKDHTLVKNATKRSNQIRSYHNTKEYTQVINQTNVMCVRKFL